MSLLSRKALARRAVVTVAGGALLVTGATGVAAAKPPGAPDPSTLKPQMELLDRGLVAAVTPDGVFLTWRLLGHEATGHGEGGLTGVDFAVHRDGELIATVTHSTNYLDAGAGSGSTYRVVALVDGLEVEAGAEVSPWDQAFLDVPLQRPADGVTPVGEAYTYSANDMSVGDVTGDGRYELVVKWDPSNSKDVSQVGYTGPVYIDTYTLEGTLLHRIDLGVNIRAGAHYTQFLVYDFDGDGRAEMMFKTAPGTSTIRYQDGEPVGEDLITMPAEDLAAGYAHDDDYRMSNEDFRAHLTQMFLTWHEHPEVVAGSWPATLEEAFGIEPRYDYPLSQTSAEELTTYLIDVYGPSRSGNNRLWNFEGFIVEGPEYLTVFDGATGAELETVHYKPGRHDDGLMWGDYAMSRIEPGNRVDRFLSGVAYLDGSSPSAVFARGYYTRSTIVAYDWDGTSLSERWYVDSGWTPMTNPFNDGPHGRDGTDPEFGTITTQGQHSLSAADVDGDGRHEIVYGAATIDDDGSLLFSAFDVMPPESADPGALARLGHGDAMHVGNLDPSRDGMEMYAVFEGGPWAPYGYAMLDAATGEVLWGAYTGRDTGRGMVGDIDPDVPGFEAWATDLRTVEGELISTARPGTNQSIRWAADMTTQIVNGAGAVTPTIDDWQRGTLLTATGTRTNNGTKGNPSLIADVFGDWREELLVRTADSSAVRIHLSTEVTDRKLYTLMHDPQYRAEIARQQTVYNQPAYTSFYLGSDVDWSTVPLPDLWVPGSLEALGDLLAGYIDGGEVAGPIAQQLTATLAQAQHHLDAGRTRQAEHALERFLVRLEQPKKPDTLSEAARTALGHQGRTVIAMLR
ncbi:rhamnogalacturonan lyase [Actinotalea sp. K2]|uniref:rhamnogalacturonan lyase n=1 Tax=Actinotalea sp. K2 TaxID=2939438 RepID=UPI002016EAA3|nr:rhamnogalacturonan lyase [Actinotalea sp. K2]MCL3860344.1 rhamnogalacturonan lyase [Actinotalea sp. K2]